MREIKTHRVAGQQDLDSNIRIEIGDEPSKKGDASCSYHFFIRSRNDWGRGGSIKFQEGSLRRILADGTVAESNANGISNEALLAVVMDRLQAFQLGPYACRQNELALQHCQEAMFWLHERTAERIDRGVEGTDKP